MLFVGYFTYGQIQFSGQITNENSMPLAGCDIHLGKNNFITDGNGNFTTNISKPGKQKLFIAYLGYFPVDTTLVIIENMTINFKMKLKVSDLSNIIINQKVEQDKTGSNSRKIKQATIEKYGSQSLGDALKEVAGVSTLKAGHNVVKPIINGLHSSRVPIINNNVRLEDQQWGTEHAPNFDINSAATIEVIKGASGLQYSGDAIGGLVLINPVVVKKDTLFGKTILALSTNGRGGVVSSSLHKGNEFGWRYNLQTSAKYFGDRTAANYVLSNTANREFNFSGDASYSYKKMDFTAFYSVYNANIGILQASHIGNVNDLYQSINNLVPWFIGDFTYEIQNPKQEVQHHLAKLNANFYLDEQSILSIQYAYQNNRRLEFDIRRGEFKNIPALALTLKTNQLLIDFKKESIHWEWKSGGAFSYQTNVANTDLTKVRPLIPTYDKIDFGLYSIFKYDFVSGWKADAGLRYDYTNVQASKFYFKTRWTERGYDADFNQFVVQEFATQLLTKPQFTFHNLSASLGAEKAFDNNWFVNTNFNLTNRNPNPAEFFSDGLHHASGVIELGDLRLKKETAVKISAFAQKKWNKFSIGINPFLHSIKNFMFLKPSREGFETTIRGAFPVFEYSQTNALLTGIDIQTDWNIHKNISHKLILGYVNGRNVSEKIPLIDMPPLNFSNKIKFEKNEWAHFIFELKHDVVLRQTRFPDYNFTTNIIKNNELVPVLVDISTPPKGYQLLGFYAEMRPKIFKKTVTTIALMGQNILNVAYRDYLNRQRFFADELGRNIQIQFKINY